MLHALDRRWLAGFWLLLAAVAVAVWGLRCGTMLNHGSYSPTTGTEETPLFCLSQSLHGEPIYGACFRYPYRVSLYNRLFYLFYRRVAVLVNPSELQLPTVLRLTTASWTLLGCLAMLWFLRGVAPGNTVLALALSVVAWFGPFTNWWTLTVRADLAALVCQYLGLLLVVQGGARLSWGQAVAAGVLFFAAWSFKQSMVWMFAGVLVALLWQREWFNLLRLGGLFALLTGALLATADQAYFDNAFLALTLAPSALRQLGIILLAAALTWGPLALTGLAMLLLAAGPEQRQQLWQRRDVRILTLTLLVALPLNLLAARRINSSTNYFFESWLLALTLAGVLQGLPPAAAETSAEAPVRRLLFRCTLILLLGLSLLTLQLLFVPPTPGEQRPREFVLYLPAAPLAAELVQDVRDSPPPLLCDDAMVLRLALGEHAKGSPVLDHGFYWDALAAGRIQDGGIQQRLQQHYYRSLWLDKDATHGDWKALAEQAGYRAVREVGHLRLYVPPAPNPESVPAP